MKCPGLISAPGVGPTLRPAVPLLCLVLVAVAACDEASSIPVPVQPAADAAVDSASPLDASQPPPGLLGMNDVTLLLPLADPGGETLLLASDKASDGNQFVTRALYDRLNRVPNRGPVVFLDDLYPLLQLVAVRFDLCDRGVPGPCGDEDGRMRLVLQAQYPVNARGNIDLGLHEFFSIPKAELPALVEELRAMAKIQGLPVTAPLQPNPTLMKSIKGEYAKRLTALVRKYGVQANLVRVTFVGARDRVATVSWTLRGLEKSGADLVDIPIPGIGSTIQDATLGGVLASFSVVPTADAPAGFTLASDETAFAAATPAAQDAAIAALNAIDNPMMTTPNNASCVTCHVSGRMIGAREQVAMADARMLPNRYTAGTFDLTVPRALKSSLRNLGWANRAALISQRVANDSAQVASEMNARFPPP